MTQSPPLDLQAATSTTHTRFKTLRRRAALACTLASVLTACGTPPAVTSAEPTPKRLVTGLAGAFGSAIGPGDALYVTVTLDGSIRRVDPKTGAVTTFVSGLPIPFKPEDGVGVVDVAFIGNTAYALVTLVGPDYGGNSAVGIYRVDGPGSFNLFADIGAFSLAHPPKPDYFVKSGAQHALEPFREGFLVTDAHHNRVLQVTKDGEVSEMIAFGNIVPTGLAIAGDTVYMAEAGPIPHLPETGRVVEFRPGDSAATPVAAGARLLVDVEFGRGRTLFALAQGFWDSTFEGAPANPNTGSLVRAEWDGTFTVVAGPLDRPTSMEIMGNTAYIVTLGGEIWTVDNIASPPSGK
ncbi:ScyD/ScyE family protein [Deinococcus marmoris]|uniref:ScyD/ScyE family protein n=1 Tax=Deinococcus marmoris TaxID=249408 RepID=UPI0004980FA4|nr:ScyD/ScyE family protein [Deinococcus marmoris]